MLDLPSTSGGRPAHSWGQGWPCHCILDIQDLGWSALPEGASELLVIVEWASVLVSLATSSHNSRILHVSAACPHQMNLVLAGVRLQEDAAAADVQLTGDCQSLL